MRFEWDSEKARVNLAKHDVSFELATRVWDDPLHVVLPDRVVHTYPEGEESDVARIIGARKATSHERRRYEAEAS